MPAPNRLQFEQALAARRGPLLTLGGLDPGPTGSNPNYDDPAREALASLGLTPASWAPGDDDFARVAAADAGRLLDVGEYRLLRIALGGFLQPDQSVGGGSRSLGSLRRDLAAEADALLALLQARYGYGAASAAAVSLSLDFEQPWPWSCRDY